jgi:hypothetical protein
MRTCFNCGKRYLVDDQELIKFKMNDLNPSETDAQLQGFCTLDCKNQDDARLVEGNGIIAQSEVQLTDLNKLKLDVSGQIGQALGGMIHFGRPKGGAPDYTNDSDSDVQKDLGLQLIHSVPQPKREE